MRDRSEARSSPSTYPMAMQESRLTLEPTAWYATRTLPVFLVVVGLAVYGFRTSLAGKSPLGRILIDD